ncbi:uncharacterized protein LOC111008132 [Momordica charantia]|uniref:Uncharacterized protein LOC111008132 n=1 Tax=Momordica charantia TaxID=3673 RepID=A0A6J1C495_MOMCH|nr:uncharacterized protein LOC111008132 [Momordica charantia]XP_022136422.1 uncharacterized protein LOC111008132 [Momordica charantia]XP_022136423.1 uncharacterized protein LOC111008132 [Momordica charantia]XP_022136424.1 uncharacterized protein LOC111008132 [Momordica charantia]
MAESKVKTIKNPPVAIKLEAAERGDVAESKVKTNKNPPIAIKEAADQGDVYNNISNLVTEMRIVANRQIDMEHRSKINDFFVCEPPCFGQETDPYAAKYWILKLETIFDCIDCSDEQRVSFAVLKLNDSALSWWIVAERHLKDEVTVTWEKFKELFFMRYFPRWMQHQKYAELCSLEQGDRTVAEYDVEFIKLCSLVYDFIGSEAWETSLHDIRIQICLLRDTTYPQVRDMALNLERRLNAQEDQD